MKTELDKCMAGEWYDCHDPIFITQKGKTRQLLARYNALPYEEKKTKQEVLKEMFGSIGNNVSVGTPFLCDYGCNIHIGDNVSVNMNCSFIDCNKITIGSHVLIASNVQIYTATHPIELSERLIPGWTNPYRHGKEKQQNGSAAMQILRGGQHLRVHGGNVHQRQHIRVP